MSDTITRLRLVRTESVGPQTYRRLMARFGTAEAALDALPALFRNAGRNRVPAIPSVSAARRELDRHAALGARVLFLGDPDYPSPLAALPDAPPMIAVAGDVSLLSRPALAVVGARNASANGRRLAEDIAADLAERGFPVVSGLARGIDGAAHRGALRTGTTIAAIPGGMDKIYPPEHGELQREIARLGAVIAEAPPGTAPIARHFPKRNRIIAGLALGVVVIEAALRSGSLITARFAAEYGREVFAVPGSPLDPRARGGNDLIRQGAHLVESAVDILFNLPLGIEASAAAATEMAVDEAGVAPDPVAPPAHAEPDVGELDAARDGIASLLSASPMTVDEIGRHCQFSPSALSAALMELELAGRIETLPGNRVGLIGAP